MNYKKYFTMSFDDGLEQDKRIIRILDKYGIKSTFNLNAGLFGTQNRIGYIGNIGFINYPEGSQGLKTKFRNQDMHRIPIDEIVQVYGGHEVASHGYRHEALSLIPKEQMEESIRRDIQTLSELMHRPICGHAYPGGSSSDMVMQCLEQNGILYAREVFCTGSFVFPQNPLRYRATGLLWDKKLFDLADRFIAAQPQESDLLFCVWGHGYELDFGTELANWDRFERFCEKISGRDDIAYCTNLCAFQEHRERIQ